MSRKIRRQEKQERLAIKDFFDRILPGTLKFYSDHYICGDSYRCVWAIKECPPSTEEQAILSQLADRSHITLRIYNRWWIQRSSGRLSRTPLAGTASVPVGTMCRRRWMRRTTSRT